MTNKVEYMREYRARPGVAERQRESQARYQLRKLYGLTQEDYDAMLDSQGGVCAICERPETAVDNRYGKIRKLAVDHCHETGRTRSLVCFACNILLGKADDNPDRLRRAADYLLAHGVRG